MDDIPPLTATFLSSAARLSQCPVDEISEIAFVGRSNAGKSSTLNRLLGSKRLARVSKTPGRTRLINLFTTSWGFRVADLPGYGYARASQKERDRWSYAVDEYLERRHNLVGLVQVIDIRHPLKDYDVNMLAWARTRDVSVLLLLNKADKLSKNQQAKALAAAKRQIDLKESETLQTFSATSSVGLESAIAWLRGFWASESDSA